MSPDVCIHGRILIAGLEVSAVAWQQYWQFINSTFPEKYCQYSKMVYAVKDMADFKSQLESAGDKLVVVDFFATW